MTVFDDSGPLLQRRYFTSLARRTTHNELYYVGPQEKAALKQFLCEKLKNPALVPLVTSLFRPSYGGNRNYTLLYSLGRQLVSADDDMRPYAFVQDDGHALGPSEICRGRVLKAGQEPAEPYSFDILGAFLDVLGKPAAKIPESYARGELLIDTAMDLETNTTRGFVRDNTLLLHEGEVPSDAVVKIAQTFRSGTNDIDALDFVEMFLEDEEQTSLDALGDVYVLSQFRPAVTNKNWRMDCGVAAYDNLDGLPPFFPTRLRFEDYVFRLWIQRPGVVAAHVPAAQNHGKSAYMRNPPAAEVLNEEIANLLKKKILASLDALSELGIDFEYDGEVEEDDAEMILDKIEHVQARVRRAAERTKDERRTEELRHFAATLASTFYGFELDLFQHNLRRILKETTAEIKSALELWPLLLEICDARARRGELPRVRLGGQN
jgi:hypothetical protein